MNKDSLKIVEVNINDLIPADYNPRKWEAEAVTNLKESIKRFGIVDPIIANGSTNRKNIVIGGHFRLKVAEDLGFKTVPVVYLNISDISKEKELNLRLNKNTGEWDWDLLAKFNETVLTDIGFSSQELDSIFDLDLEPEKFDLQKELAKLSINTIEIQKGQVWQLGEHRLMCGDSTVEQDILKLVGNEKANMCFTDPPYILDYLHGKKKHGNAITGFGAKRDRRYLETDVLPPDFTEKWLATFAYSITL